MMRRFIFVSIFSIGVGLSAAAQDDASVDSLMRELQEVMVTARQPVTRLVGTSLVSTISGSSLQYLGTALDVLSQLPMIRVEDSGVSVAGKGVPEIYIDGRPMRLSDELTKLQSINIKKIELQLAPGAAYSSDTGAVLKITTRRNFVDGLSVLDRAEVTARRKWSASDLLDLNYRVRNLDLFASAIVGRSNSVIKGSTTNTLEYEDREVIIGSSQYKSYPSTSGAFKAGFNHTSGEQSFGAYFRFGSECGKFANYGTEWIGDESPVVRRIDTRSRDNGTLVSLYYDNTFFGKYHMHFDGDYQHSRAVKDEATTYPNFDLDRVCSDALRHSTLWAGKWYCAVPMACGRLTVGTQNSYTHTVLNSRMLSRHVSDYVPSSLSDAGQISAALFATWDRTFGPLSLTAGLRYEYVDYRFWLNGVKDDCISRTNQFLTPDISLSYVFDEESQLSLSYKMATLRPPYASLTGSLSYVGRHEIEGGNPALMDERMHDVGFWGIWHGFILQADYTRSIDSYAFVKRIYPAPTLQLIMQPVNIDVSALDMYLVWSKTMKSWTPDVTLGLHKQWLSIGGARYDRPIISYGFDNTVNLAAGWLVTLNASGQTEGDMQTNRFGATWLRLDASVGKSFLGKSLQLKLSVTDILNTRNNDWTMRTYGIFVDKRQTYDRRGISLTATYRFQPRRDAYKGRSAAPAEQSRL